MACNDQRVTMDQRSNNLKIIRHPLFHTKPPPWFDLRVFYVRVSNFEVDDSTPDHLTLNHIPPGPDTILEVNGWRSSSFSECVSTQLRRDRFDKNSDEVTFVNTDSMRITGTLMFEVYDGDDLLLSGVLELCKENGLTGEAKGLGKKWTIKCQSHITSARRLVKGKQCESLELPLPTVEVYVAGCFSGTPIILSKTLHPGYSMKNHRKSMLDSIPENDSSETEKDLPVNSTQIPQYCDYRPEVDNDGDYKNLYGGRDYMEDEDGELSWFNAGVRVGVGIGLGICIGVGLGVGLLVRSYHSASRNFRRRLF